MAARARPANRRICQSELLPADRQIAQQLAHVLIPLVARLRQRTLDHGDELERQARVDVRQRLRHLVQDLEEGRREGIAGKRLPPAEQLVKDDADGKDVGAMIRALAADLLGRHVVHRAHQHVTAGELGRQQPGEPEVEDLHRAAVGDVDVCRLDVAVDDAARMRVLEPEADVHRELDLAPEAHSFGTAHARLKVFALEELHREIRLTLVLAEVVNRDDVRVRELAGGARLADEPLARLGVPFNRRGDDLQRHHTLDERVEGAVDHPHTALAELLENLITADRRHATWEDGRRLGGPDERRGPAER